MTQLAARRIRRTTLAISIGFLSLLSPAFAQTLYNPALGTTPGSQGWLEVVPAGATQSVSGGVLSLSTLSGNAVQAGYGRTDRTLDRATGYSLNFSAQLVAEAHANNNRAGFSVIAIGNDLRGIELGFWTDRVWAQEGNGANLFTQAEGTSFDTATALVGYSLRVSGNDYRLFANDTQILTGTLRSYNSFVGFPNPYTVPNSLFFGDDTTSARADTRLGAISLSVAPEPASVTLTIVGVGCWAFVGKRRRRAK